jgi:hypothetical protein
VVVPSHLRFHCQGPEPVPTFWLHFNCCRRPAPTQAIPIELPVEEGRTGLDDQSRRAHSAE